MRRLIPFLSLLLVAIAASAQAEGPREARPGPQDRIAAAPESPLAGPVQARDPEVRSQIKQLYRDRHELELATRTELQGLVVRIAAETDPALRLELQKQAGGLKRDLQLRSMELGLEIARLNGDEPRVAEYERALDHLLHPESHRPAPIDPAPAIERARALGHAE